MRKIFILYIISPLLFISCSNYNELFNSGNNLRNQYEFSGLEAIELTTCDTLIRIWIDRNSRVDEILTIYMEDNFIYGRFVEIGYNLPENIFGNRSVESVFTQESLIPKQGWTEFFNELKKYNFYNKEDRMLRNDEGVPWIGPYAGGTTAYLVEIKKGKSIHKYKFFSYFPIDRFKKDMEDYKNIERIFYTSFDVLEKKLHYYREFFRDTFFVQDGYYEY